MFCLGHKAKTLMMAHSLAYYLTQPVIIYISNSLAELFQLTNTVGKKGWKTA